MYVHKRMETARQNIPRMARRPCQQDRARLSISGDLGRGVLPLPQMTPRMSYNCLPHR